MIELILPPQYKMKVNGISAYRLYLTLKLHFAGKRDVLKYNWEPIKCSDDAFKKARGKYFFERMSSKFTLGELCGIMITNFAANPDAWGGEIADADALAFYRQAIGRFEMASTIFKDEVDAILTFGYQKGIKFKDLIYSTNGQPWIFKFVQQKIISYETMIMLDVLFNFVDTYDKLNDHVWANGYADRIKAYRRMVRVNKEQIKSCFKETVENFKKYRNIS